ncbi:hypothetical protein ANN_03212 [Periplaneta americana]|uniref:Reverse transcriptase domain-containing protein n=1 Tax=Periplaneta americana TaxID=6978 RepID=A0ABQ8U160_PERAM|nr:hypothetical protein ANN_03212 [Periplaneta americana]
MSPGSNTESYPAFAHIGLRENPGKTSTRQMVAFRCFNLGTYVFLLYRYGVVEARLKCRFSHRYSTGVNNTVLKVPGKENGLTHNRILIDKRKHTSIVDIRTFRGADCNSDHYLVIGELRERLSVAKIVEQQVNITKFNILKLKDEEAKQNYQVEISNRFATLESSDEVEKELDVNSVWENIRDSIKIAAEQSIDYYETKKKKPWFDEDCCMVAERRKQAKLKFLQDPIVENRDNYFNERREILEKKWEYKGTVHQLFIDIKKAYDSVKRELLYDILIEFGIPKKLVRLIKMCLSETYSRVRIVPTRWGSWLEACNYYARHIQSVKKVVQSFDTDDAAAIQIRQELLNDETIEKEVTDIKSNFGYLPDAIIQLGKSGVELVEQINIMRTIVNKLSAVEGEIGKRVGEKMNKVLIKNDGYDSRISDVLTKTCPNDVIQHVNLIDYKTLIYRNRPEHELAQTCLRYINSSVFKTDPIRLVTRFTLVILLLEKWCTYVLLNSKCLLIFGLVCTGILGRSLLLGIPVATDDQTRKKNRKIEGELGAKFKKDGDRWRAYVRAAMNLRVPFKAIYILKVICFHNLMKHTPSECFYAKILFLCEIVRICVFSRTEPIRGKITLYDLPLHFLYSSIRSWNRPIERIHLYRCFNRHSYDIRKLFLLCEELNPFTGRMSGDPSVFHRETDYDCTRARAYAHFRCEIDSGRAVVPDVLRPENVMCIVDQSIILELLSSNFVLCRLFLLCRVRSSEVALYQQMTSAASVDIVRYALQIRRA